MEELNIVAANKSEEVATPSENNVKQNTMENVSHTEKSEDITQTKAFSRRLKEMTDKAVNEATEGMKQQIAELTNKRQDQELLANNDVKDIYTAIRSDVLKYADENKTDILTAYKEILATNMPTLLKNLKERINEEAEKRLKENIGVSPGKLASNIASVKKDYSNATPKEMDEYINQALRGELRSN